MVDGTALRSLLSLEKAEIRFIESRLISLGKNPFTAGDFQETNAEGRTVEVLVRGKYMVTFWADHAVKELRVIRLEQVQLQ